MARFMLEGPRPCTIFCFALRHYVTKTFLLLGTSVRCEQLLCFEHGQGQKKRKPYNKEICRGFITIPFLLTMITPTNKTSGSLNRT